MKKSEYRAAVVEMRKGKTPKGWGKRNVNPSKLARRVNRISPQRDKQHQVRGGGL